MLDFITAAIKYVFDYLKENFFTLYFVATMGQFLGDLFIQWQKKRKEKKQEQKDQ